MRWFRRIFSRQRRYHDLALSMREHLAEKIDELMDDGLSRRVHPARAPRCFHRAYGGTARRITAPRPRSQPPGAPRYRLFFDSLRK